MKRLTLTQTTKFGDLYGACWNNIIAITWFFSRLVLVIGPTHMPAARDEVEGRWHLQRDKKIMKNHVITIITTYPSNLENIFIICLQWQHMPTYLRITTLLNITDHHLRCQLATTHPSPRPSPVRSTARLPAYRTVYVACTSPTDTRR